MKQLKFTSNTMGEKMGIAVSRTNKKLFECSLKFLFINQTEYKLFFIQAPNTGQANLIMEKREQVIKNLGRSSKIILLFKK